MGSEEQKSMHKAMSSEDLPKADTLRKNAQDGRWGRASLQNTLGSYFLVWRLEHSLPCFLGRVRGKMRFWGKTKYSDKKSSREKLICGGDSMDGEYGDTGLLMGDGGWTHLTSRWRVSLAHVFQDGWKESHSLYIGYPTIHWDCYKGSYEKRRNHIVIVRIISFIFFLTFGHISKNDMVKRCINWQACRTREIN